MSGATTNVHKGTPIGYSKRSLCEKLGVKSHFRVAIIHAPPHYMQLLTSLPPQVQISNTLTDSPHIIHFFTTEIKELEKFFPKLKRSLLPNSILWVSWPKSFSIKRRTSLLPTDLNENIIRGIGLKNGLVDVKVIAIDKDWSGLKFVYRLKDRPPLPSFRLKN